MSAVAVVTDTTHYLPAEHLRAAGVAQVSLYVNHGGTQRREADITDLRAFYDELRRADDLPTTSQPSVGDFLAVFEPLAQAGRDIVAVHLAGGLSGTVESARQAAAQITEQHPGRRVEVVDSRTACGGLGMVVEAAARAAAAGGDVDAVRAAAQEGSEHSRIWFAVDTLEFLRRGGRIGAAQAWLGGALRIKPILTVRGEITPIERVRTSGRAQQRMREFLDELHGAGVQRWVVQHIQAPDEAAALVDYGRGLWGTEPDFVSEVGPVIGSHVGPGLLGVGGIPDPELELRGR
jgi:DegV family protein with EDD domain